MAWSDTRKALVLPLFLRNHAEAWYDNAVTGHQIVDATTWSEIESLFLAD